jgi:hypothetical protein
LFWWWCTDGRLLMLVCASKCARAVLTHFHQKRYFHVTLTFTIRLATVGSDFLKASGSVVVHW